MREAVHSDLIRVRVPPALLVEVKAKAEMRHMSPSELVRQALRREVEATA